MTANALRALKGFVRGAALEDHCELCAAPLSSTHAHLLAPARQSVLCACTACSLLFSHSDSDRLVRIHRHALRLTLELDDAAWARLGVPVGVAFVTTRRDSKLVTAHFPGRAGLVESSVEPAVWHALCAEHAELATIESEVEALLVRRSARKQDYFRVSIDHCYELTSLLRTLPAPLGMPDPEILDEFFAALGATRGGFHRTSEVGP
ncbi:MAG TPA: DUF5947 family protein [Polyangiaceae bacterium]|nr:DUF5947 family protein [Polyangiaceae bacterium]